LDLLIISRSLENQRLDAVFWSNLAINFQRKDVQTGASANVRPTRTTLFTGRRCNNAMNGFFSFD
jgi:hypothetical protein